MFKIFDTSGSDAPSFCSAALILITLVIVFSKISLNGLPCYDDAYYAEKSKEVMTAGNVWLGRFAGGPSYDNPPMHFWITASSFKVFGVNEFGARFPSAVFVLLIMVLGYRMASLVFRDKWAGFFTVLALVTTNFIVRQAFRSMLDVTLVFFEMLSLYLFMLALRGRGIYFFTLAGVFTGFAILTKSVMGAYPAAVMFFYLLIDKKWRVIFSAGFAAYIISALAVAAPWYIVNYMDGGLGFLKFHFGVLIGGMAGGSTGVKFTPGYLKVMFSYGLPWMPLALYGSYEMIRREWKKDGENLFLVFIIWAWLIVLGLSFTSTVKSWYIMPAFAASAVISGYLLYTWLKSNAGFITAAVAVYGIAAAVIVVLPVGLNSHKSNDIKALVPFVRALVPPGGSVLNYKMPYWEIENPLIFYSDRSVTQPIEEPAALLSGLEKGGIAMTTADKYDSDLKSYSSRLALIAVAGDKVLFCGKRFIGSIGTPLFIIKKP